MMQLTKLDRRFDGNDRFSHRVQFLSYSAATRVHTQQTWIKVRNWLWTQFGPSAELGLARPYNFQGQQPKWAWDSDKSAIYLKDEALAMFLLKWESWKNEPRV